MEDGPNLYAYVHNSPFIHFDAHGLFTWSEAWEATQEFALGAASVFWDGFKGVERSSRSMGQWMIADSFAEMGERTPWEAKGQESWDLWREFGNELYERSMSTAASFLAPGIIVPIYENVRVVTNANGNRVITVITTTR